MNTPAHHTCCTCGYTWLHGQNGSHSCTANLVTQLQALSKITLATERTGRVYLAGPMTGYEQFNFPAFNAEAERLRAAGWHVKNPADHGHVDGAEWADYLRYDIWRLATCEAIHLLPGWQKSRGAKLEVHIAKALGMKIRYAHGAESAAELMIDQGADFLAMQLAAEPKPEPYKLDPVSVIVEDHEPGRGRLILECAGESWSAWWGAMSGRTVAQFVCDSGADYIIGCIASQVRESRFSGTGLHTLAKRSVITRRLGEGDYWEYGDRLDKHEAAELWSELDDLQSVESDQACWRHSDLLTRLFGEEWWHMASTATESNPAYHYLQRLVAAVQAGLLEAGLAQPKKGKVAA